MFKALVQIDSVDKFETIFSHTKSVFVQLEARFDKEVVNIWSETFI